MWSIHGQDMYELNICLKRLKGSILICMYEKDNKDNVNGKYLLCVCAMSMWYTRDICM